MNSNHGVVGDAMTTQPATQGLPDLLMPPPPAGLDLGGSIVQDAPAADATIDENNGDRSGRRGG
jgi:hypothetical protein